MVHKIQRLNLNKSSLPDRLKHVTQVIREAERKYRGQPGSVELLAVSKTQPADIIKSAYKLGVHQFGESYLDEAINKQQQLIDLDICWHFIGRIQSNKTAEIATRFDWAHSIDRLKIAHRLNDQRPNSLPPINVCLQINVDHEPNKAGVNIDQAADLLSKMKQLPRLHLRGLMCIPAPRKGFDAQRIPYARLSELYKKLNNNGAELDTLSIGMSQDTEAAIAEGATLVRIGSALFGPRSV